MIHLNIGSNLPSAFGTKFQNIGLAIHLLIESNIKILKISDFFFFFSYPNKYFPKFINIGVLINCDFNYSALLKKTSLIEKKIGRIKSKKNYPRVCDIDVIDFNGSTKVSKNLKLPHPRCHLRNFVLYPIKEIDPVWMHPILRKNVDDLIKDLSKISRIEITRLSKSVNIKT